MGPTWVLSAPDGPHVGPINLAMREINKRFWARWLLTILKLTLYKCKIIIIIIIIVVIVIVMMMIITIIIIIACAIGLIEMP